MVQSIEADVITTYENKREILRKEVKGDNVAQKTAEILFNTNSIVLSAKEPFEWTSGIKSPIYVDCRRIMSFPEERTVLMDFMSKSIDELFENDYVDAVAGGESAGIPYAAFVAERLKKPMLYVRKARKEHGKKQVVEGVFSRKENRDIQSDEPHVLLIEDHASNGQSKFGFINSLRNEGIRCHDCFTIFYYDIFPVAQKTLDEHQLAIHSLARGQDILTYIEGNENFTQKERDALARFLSDPLAYQP